ncbi:MAG: type IV secretion system DNA-binding domain-containing protein [bacterium]
MADELIPHNKDTTYFARTNFRSTNQIFGIKRKDRRQHMYILGKSGTGKSVLMSNLIVQNIQNGEGVCVVDPHGELVEEILHSIPENRVKDVIYFNPADTEFAIGFNVIQVDDPKYKHLVASGLMGIFTKIWANAWSARMEYILNNAILALLDTPNTTLLGIPRLLVDKDYRQMIISNLKDPVVKAFWVHEYEQWREQFRNEAIAPIQNKVGQFLSTSIIRNVVGQSTSTIDIFKVMNEGKIFLVNVSKGRIGEDNSALLGGMIITKIQLAAMERVRIPEDERKDFYLYVDEFQNFATDAFANILSEARKYRLNLTIAHQYTAQIENKDGSQVRDAVFGNVGTMIIFRVGADDADFLEKEFEPEFMAQDLVNLPNYNVYLKLMIDGVTSRPFSATTLPPIKIDPADGVKDSIIESSRRLYAKPRAEIEDQISQWSGMVQAKEGEKAPRTEFNSSGNNGNTTSSSSSSFQRQTRREEDRVTTDPLAALGIEFTGSGKPASQMPRTASGAGNGRDFHKSAAVPSQGLKDLLGKIEADKNTVSSGPKHQAQSSVPSAGPAPISLAALKSNNAPTVSKPAPQVKEASEEKKEILKNLINEVKREEAKVEPKQEPTPQVTITPPTPAPVPEPKIVAVKEEPKTTPKSPEGEAKPEPVIQKVAELRKIEDDMEMPVPKPPEDYWKKKRPAKEVPEDVLRRILE